MCDKKEKKNRKPKKLKAFCYECNKPVERYNNKVLRVKTQIFCSQRCYTNNFCDKKSRHQVKNWGERKCGYIECHKILKFSLDNQTASQRKYCSFSCYRLQRNLENLEKTGFKQKQEENSTFDKNFFLRK